MADASIEARTSAVGRRVDARGWTRAAALVALGTSAALYALTARLPFFSETWSVLQSASALAGALDAFDPALHPYRPLQHLYFVALAGWAEAHPALARAPGFALHVGACVLVAELVRLLGGSRRAGFVGALAFALFPGVKAVFWVAAISWPARCFLTLASLCLFLRHVERPSAWSGLGFVLCFVAALLFSQGAVGLPILLVLVLAAREGWRGAWRRRGEPWLLASFALLAGYLAFLLLLRGEAVGGGGAGVIPGNVARASFALLPEALRVPVLDGLRGLHGAAGRALAASAWLLAAGVFALAFARGSAAVRALLAGVAVELLPLVTSTGFSQRYAYVAAALLAVAIGLASERWARAPGLAVASALLLAAWAFDSGRDVLELRRAGAMIERTLAGAEAARAAAGPEAPILLVDPPMFAGSEEDVPVFNWGIRRALEWRGAGGPWHLVRTLGPPWPMEFPRVEPAELARRVAAHPGPVLVFDRELADWRPMESSP